MSTLIEAFKEARRALVKEQNQLARRIAKIEAMLGFVSSGQPIVPRQKRRRGKGSVSAAIAQVLQEHEKGLSSQEIKAKLPTIKPTTINATLSTRRGKEWKRKGKLWVTRG